MSDLHFDAEGEPATVPADADELRVRRFRKPGERGACEIVHGADGAPLFVPVDATYLELRKLVNNAPGRYRLDPVDASRRSCAHSVPLYVTIEPTRNAAASGDERDGTVAALLKANVEMMQANAKMTRHVVKRFASMMTATAEILRAADGAGLPRREPLPPVPRNDNHDALDDEDDDQDDDDQDDGDQDDDADPANPLAATVAHFLQQAMPLLETYVTDRMVARRRAEAAAPAPAAVTAPATPVAPTPAVTDAGPSPATTTAATPTAAPTPIAASTPATVPSTPDGAAAPAEVRNAAPASPPAAPTADQLAHLVAVKAQLSPQEQRVVMTAVPRMDPAARAHWLGELCALPIEDAAARVRSMMPPLRPEPRPTTPPKAPKVQKEKTP